MRRIAALFCLLPLLLTAVGEPEGWAYETWNELMSPFCPGRTLADCPSPQADQLRMWILVQEAAGRPRADVEDELLERFGDVVLAAPRASGFGLAAYLVPVLAFLVGGVLVLALLRRWTKVESHAVRAQAVDPELERAIGEELAR